MSRFRMPIFSLILACGIAGIVPAGTSVWLEYEPSISELRGTVVTREHYGPPNFGETPDIDKKESVPILVLKEPVSVRGNPRSVTDQETERNITEIHLVFGSRYSSAALSGREVAVIGTLFHAVTGHHATKVLMNVHEIRPRERE